MKTQPEKSSHKLGPNHNEFAVKQRKHDPNFAQSRDIREDRGERQFKSACPRQTLPRGQRM